MGGKAAGSGFDFQSRVNAFVAAHMLARRQLRWTRLATRDVPISMQAESGRGGDDVRVELADSSVIYECQAKKTLFNDARLAEAADKFAGLAGTPMERGILIVDPGSGGTIKTELRDALDAWRDGTGPAIRGALETVHERLTAASAVSVLERLSVEVLDLEQDASPGAEVAALMLAPLLKDGNMAGAAWRVLISDGLTLCRTAASATETPLSRCSSRNTCTWSRMSLRAERRFLKRCWLNFRGSPIRSLRCRRARRRQGRIGWAHSLTRQRLS